MRRDRLLLTAGLLMAVGALLSALVSPVSAQDSVRFEGRAYLADGGSQGRLVISAGTPEGDRRLEATLALAVQRVDPTGRPGQRFVSDDDHENERGGERQGRNGRDDRARQQAGSGFDLTGTFTLTSRNGSVQDGTATGIIAPDGSGSLTLTDSKGTEMKASFLLDSSGRLQLDLAGPAPAEGQVGQAATTASAVSTQAEGDHTFWFLARAAGLSAYLMLFLNVFLGLAVRSKVLEALLARWRSFDLHQFTALLALGFLALHGLALLGDRYIGFSPAELLVPFASPYRPVWTALGVMALYLFLGVLASSYLRKLIGQRLWRAIHYSAFVAFLLAMAHGIFAGSDSSEPWAAALYGGTGSIIGLLVILRVKSASGRVPAQAPRPLPVGEDLPRAA